ncbi:MAG: SBBP repeat-containing protein, partial [Chthoniobacterales bacterium]
VFPTVNAYQPSYGGGSFSPFDGFVARIDPTVAGTPGLTYSTYLGGSGQEAANGIAVDSAGNAYVTGYTASSDFPHGESAASWVR